MRRALSASFTPGQILLGRYRLVQPINEGGMSVVWAAEHTVTGKQVALKLLKADAASDESVKRRMLREARAACAVVHPNILPVHDVLQLADGSPVLVMDLLAGESLRDRLLRRPVLDLDEAATLLLPVISGVGTAHAAGVVHRDLKPENIFLSNESGEIRVRILDFGIAKLVGPTSSLTQSNIVTNAGMMLGTPYYMAPEQVLGEPIDHRADIWSLGVILYECLAGERPTEDENIGRVLRRVITHDIEPLSSKVKGLPADVIALVDRMLSLDVKDRPVSLREVGEVLAPHAAGISLGSFGAPASAPVSADITDDRGPIDSRAAGTGPHRRMSDEYADTLIAGRPSDPAPRPSDPSVRQVIPALSQTAAVAEPESAAARPRGRAGGGVRARSVPMGPQAAPNSGALRPRLVAAGAGLLFGAVVIAVYLRFGGGVRAPYLPATVTAINPNNGPCPAGMGYVPAGAFRMGSDDGKGDEQPVHEVQVAAFCLDLTEVTAEAYGDCVQRGECRPAESTVNWQGIADDVKNRESVTCTAYSRSGGGLPMNCISWDASDAYCRAAGKRLPTEPEWEYAAGGGAEHRTYPWGNTPPRASLLNACDRSCAEAALKQGGEDQKPLFDEDDGAPALSPVGRYPLGDSKFGMHDMAGNVWEWTSSPYCTYPDHGCASPHRVFRGAGWGGRYVTNVRVTARMWSLPAHRYNDVGFRCAKDAK